MHRRAVFAVACVLAPTLGSCTDNAAAPIGQKRDCITGGRPDGDHAVVVLLGREEKAWCSGNLIGSRTVLTAAHCLSEAVTRVYSGTGMAREAGMPFDARNLTAHAVTEQLAHPGYSVPASIPADVPDLAVLRLDGAIELEPLQLAEASPAVGTACVVVGFGLSFAAGKAPTSGERRAATVTVHAVTPRYIEVEPGDGSPSSGDSGGGLLCGGELVGVAHAVKLPYAYYDRVDAEQREHREWIGTQSGPEPDCPE